MTDGATTEYQVEYGDSPAYRWTIRCLYATAIGMEIWVLWKATADDVEVEIVKEKVRRWVRAKVRPLQIAQAWPMAVTRMHNQANWVLKEADDARP